MDEQQKQKLMELTSELKLYADTLERYCHVPFEDRTEQKLFLYSNAKCAMVAAFKVDKHIEATFRDVYTPLEQDIAAYETEREKITKTFT